MIVYLATCLENGKSYVGKTNKSLNIRINAHVCEATRRPKVFFHKALAKYGKDAFVWQVLADVAAQSAATLEQLWIVLLNTRNQEFGYNITAGGEGVVGFRHKHETKLKMRAAKLGHRASAETRQKMSKSQLGRIYNPAWAERCRQVWARRKACP